MSFSSDVKEELSRQFPKARHCQIAELAGMLELEGRCAEDGTVELFTENTLLLDKYRVLAKKAFGKEDMGAHMMEVFCGLPERGWRADGMWVQHTCCKRAFIRGAFMAAGSISDPNKSYHFEIVCTTMEQAVQLKEVIEYFDAQPKIVERKERFVVYLKEGEQIVDMLNVMEAYVALMKLENVRILKDMRNSINRKVNCETANLSKTVNAAYRQVEDIKKIRDTVGLESLSPQLLEMAQVRLEYPDASLKELGTYLDPPVGKSGVNHRLRKLSEMAEKL